MRNFSILIVCYILNPVSSWAQIIVEPVGIQELSIGSTHYIRINDSDTLFITDTTAQFIRSCYQVNNRIQGEYVEKDTYGRILIKASLDSDRRLNGSMPSNMEHYFHGPCVRFHNNGLVACEAQYKNGSLEGVRRKWDESGQLISKEVFDNGFLDSTNFYYHKNSCSIQRIVKCRARHYYSDTIEIKEISIKGMLTNWYVKDSINYHWNETDGYSIKLYNTDGNVLSKKWFTSGGILQKMDSFSFIRGGDTYQTSTFNDKGILQYHKQITTTHLENITSDIAVAKSEIKEWKYSAKGVLIQSSTRIERDTIQAEDDDDYPEETEEVFEWFYVSELANPMGGYTGLSGTLNEHFKDYRIKNKYKGQFTFDIRVEKDGKVSICEELNDQANDKNLLLNEICIFLKNYKWAPHKERDQPCATVQRVSVVIK